MEQFTQLEIIYIRTLVKDEIIKNQLLLKEKEKQPEKYFTEITYIKLNLEQLFNIYNKINKQ